jgi:hypothetical protein
MERTVMMKLRLVAAGAAFLLMAGCASSPDVRGDFDPAADFGRFRTFGFVEQAGTDAGDARSITTTLLQNAAAREMQARGYVRSDTPDLVINFHGRLEERVDIQSRPAPSMGPTWGYRGWAGSPWGGWGGTEVTTRRYNVGTLVIDLVDLQQRQMVFQGSVQDTVTRQMQQNREQTINEAVAQVFARFPFVAGQSAPVKSASGN